MAENISSVVQLESSHARGIACLRRGICVHDAVKWFVSHRFCFFWISAFQKMIPAPFRGGYLEQNCK